MTYRMNQLREKVASCQLLVASERQRRSSLATSNQQLATVPGFTLIELVLVMSIIALMAAIIAPSLRQFSMGRRTKDSAALVVGLAEYARTAAMSEGRTYRLNFDPVQRQVWLTAQDGATFSPPSNEYGERYSLADGVNMSVDLTHQQDGQYVQFSPSGRTQTVHVTLTGPLGDTVQLACASATEVLAVVPAGQ
jgi:prepilin-type N-terminal cleavage/methylation domain-containing protein